jgi:hypothetical protein
LEKADGVTKGPQANTEQSLNNSTNLAAEFFVASQLHRLGYIVTLTLGNTKEVDLLVAHPDGRTITIDVKGLKNKTNWPLTLKLIRSTHFFALVSYVNHFNDMEFQPEIFVIPSTQISKVLTRWSGNEKVTCVGYSKLKNSKYRNAWPLLFK